MDVFTGKRVDWMVLPILYLKMAHLGVVFLIFREFITSTLHLHYIQAPQGLLDLLQIQEFPPLEFSLVSL